MHIVYSDKMQIFCKAERAQIFLYFIGVKYKALAVGF